MHKVLASLIFVLSLGVSGCAEYAYWHGRTFYNVDCSPKAVASTGGYCVELKKGQSHAQTAQP